MFRDNKQVSIIVPVYNAESYLCRCLDSIVAQTFTDFEAVLVDDGSCDQSGAICDEYAAKDSRFVVIHKQNEGVAKARITAFEHSKGELITFIDSDDYVLPEYLEKLSKPIFEENADMVSSEIYNVNDGNVVEYAHKLSGSYEGEQLKDFIANHYYYEKGCGYGMTCYLCTKMIKRDYVLDGLKYGQGLWYGEDQAAMLHILYSCNKLVLIPDRMYFYVQHQGQATCNYKKDMWRSLIAFFEKCQQLDEEKISTKSFRIRTWIYIQDMIFNKMVKSSLTRQEFSRHLKDSFMQPYMQSFFSPYFVNPVNVKDLLVYWLLKWNHFSLLYTLICLKKEKVFQR